MSHLAVREPLLGAGVHCASLKTPSKVAGSLVEGAKSRKGQLREARRKRKNTASRVSSRLNTSFCACMPPKPEWCLWGFPLTHPRKGSLAILLFLKLREMAPNRGETIRLDEFLKCERAGSQEAQWLNFLTFPLPLVVLSTSQSTGCSNSYDRCC